MIYVFKSNWSSDFWSRRKRKWSEKVSGFVASNFFAPCLKISDKTMFEQQFAFSLLVSVHMRQFNFDFNVFSSFWIGFYSK